MLLSFYNQIYVHYMNEPYYPGTSFLYLTLQLWEIAQGYLKHVNFQCIFFKKKVSQ